MSHRRHDENLGGTPLSKGGSGVSPDEAPESSRQDLTGPLQEHGRPTLSQRNYPDRLPPALAFFVECVNCSRGAGRVSSRLELRKLKDQVLPGGRAPHYGPRCHAPAHLSPLQCSSSPEDIELVRTREPIPLRFAAPAPGDTPVSAFAVWADATRTSRDGARLAVRSDERHLGLGERPSEDRRAASALPGVRGRSVAG